MNNHSKTFWIRTETEREFLENVELIAKLYCENDDVNKQEIYDFIKYLYNVYGYINLLKDK